MPRRKLGDQEPRSVSGSLVNRLADELKSQRETGQPMVYEQSFEGGRIRTTVVWDDWASLSYEDRTSIILEAYGRAEGADFRKNIVLASGLTVPEAESAGMLPFQVIAALRKDDPVTAEQCREAMIDVGASVLFDPERPQLRLATAEEADATVNALVEKLPESAPIWVVNQDVGKLEDWLVK
jgi:hypothetical protein